MTTHVLNPLRKDHKIASAALAAGLLLLFLSAFDQGQTLSVLQGNVANAQELIHEAVHDARHVIGVPCD